MSKEPRAQGAFVRPSLPISEGVKGLDLHIMKAESIEGSRRPTFGVTGWALSKQNRQTSRERHLFAHRFFAEVSRE